MTVSLRRQANYFIPIKCLISVVTDERGYRNAYLDTVSKESTMGASKLEAEGWPTQDADTTNHRRTPVKH